MTESTEGGSERDRKSKRRTHIYVCQKMHNLHIASTKSTSNG